MKTKTWPHLPVCTSALRWLEGHYCFHGHNFTKFNPVTGEVSGNYPKDARHYFMRCTDFGKLVKRRAKLFKHYSDIMLDKRQISVLCDFLQVMDVDTVSVSAVMSN